MKERIYLVRLISRFDYDIESDEVFAFKNRENAKKKFAELVDGAKNDFAENYDTCDEGEDYFELYDEGWSVRDCYSIFLREVEIED